MPGDCGLIDHIAGDLVERGFEDFQTKAERFRNEAKAFLDELLNNDNLDIRPVNVNIASDLDVPDIAPIVKPPAPVVPELIFEDIDPPLPIAISEVEEPSFDEAPEVDFEKPSIVLPAQPHPLDAAAPGDAPEVSAVELPAVPDVSALPEVPSLRELDMPVIPDLSLPVWSGTAPVANLVPPGEIFVFATDPYTDDLLDEVKAKVKWMLQGGTGIPAAVWDAIWDRGRAREQEAAQKLIDEATSGWAGRGFELPPGALATQVLQARQALQNAEATLSREIAVKAAELEQGNLQFAVQQGIALENVLIGLHNAEQERAYQIARFAQEAAIAVFNAKVAYFNAQLAAYQTDAQVFRTLVEGELAKLETYKARLEGQKLIGEINEQDVRVYLATLEGLRAKVELYRSQVEGVRALVETDRQRIEAFKATVEAYGERVRAKQSEIQQYAEAVRGELAKAQLYELETNVFARRIEAWRTKTQALSEQKRFGLEMNESRIRRFAAEVEAYRSRVGAEAERVRAQATLFDAEARVYTSQIGAETARVDSEARVAQLTLDKGRLEADLELRQAQVNIEQIQRLLALELERIKTVNNVHAQLAAATMSAVNLSAGIHESASNSAACTTSYNYDQTG